MSAAASEATKQHIRGSTLLVGGRGIALALNFLVQVVTVRYLPKADYGIYAFALSVVTLSSVVCAFGMDKTASRFLPTYLQDRDYPRFWGAVFLLLATVAGMGVLFMLLFFAAWTIGLLSSLTDSRTCVVLALLVGLALCDALGSVMVSLFAVLASPAAIFVRRHLLGPLLRLAATVVVVLASGSVYAFAAGQMIAGVLGLAVSCYLLRELLGKHPELQSAVWRRPKLPVGELYSYGAAVLGGDLSYLLRIAFVPILLGILFTSESVAAYQAVVPLARLNDVVLVTTSVLFIPMAAKLAAAACRAELQELHYRTTVWITLISYPIFAFLFLGSNLVPVLLFGEAYRSSGTILALLAVAFFTNAALGTNRRVLRAVGNVRTLIAVDVVATVGGVALIIWLVPRHAAVGAAWAVCGMLVIQSLAYQIAVVCTTGVNAFSPKCLAPYLVGLGLAVGAESIRRALALPDFVGLPVAALFALALPLLFWKSVNLAGIFPELVRLPLVGRWFASLPAEKSTSL